MTVIQTINVGEVTKALEAWLKSWPGLLDIQATIERSEPVNESPDRCPWVGIYRARAGFPQRALGLGSGYRRQEVSLVLVLTESSTDSGEDCEDRLEALVQAVTSALCNNESISGTVNTLAEIDVTYTDYTAVGANFFQQAVVSVTASTNVIAS